MTDDHFDLFISHAEADRGWVEGFLLDALEAAGLRVLREATFHLGAPRVQEFARAVTHSDRTLLVLSPSFMSDGAAQLVALLGQQFGLETRTWPVIPLTLREVDRPDPMLSLLVSLDARRTADWPAVVARLCAELKHPLRAEIQRPPCPYPGMRAFRIDEVSAFFGRAVESRQLVERHLRLHPFVAIIGASGSGKSSLAFAGLVPALERSDFFRRVRWQVRSMRPGADPQRELHDALAGANEQGPRLLIVDQFEELFTLARLVGDAERTAFCETLLDLARKSGWHVVLTVRADFYGELMHIPALWAAVREHRFELTPLGRDALHAAIVEPAASVRVEVEPALVERLLADAGNEPGILPFLQETMVLLWESLERRYLPVSTYDDLLVDAQTTLQNRGKRFRNGLEVAMAARADNALASLPTDAARQMARRVLLRLVQFGEGRADARRQQRVSQLRSADDDIAVFALTVDQLVRARLLIASGAEGLSSEDTPMDIAHEALLSGWPQLAEWIAQRRDAEQMRRWLNDTAEKWLQRGTAGQVGGLLDQVELLEAERWRERFAALVGLDEPVALLIAASRADLERSHEAAEVQRQRELEQQRQLAEAQRARAEDAEGFAAKQIKLNEALRQSIASSSFVHAVGLVEGGRADRALARLVQTLQLDPAHESARTLLYALLTRRWHLRPSGPELDHGEPVIEVAVSPDGRRLACRGRSTTWVHSPEQHQDVVVLRHPSTLQSMHFDAASKRLLTTCSTFGASDERHGATGTIELWSLETGTRLHVVEIRGLVTGAVFGGGEQRIYVSSAFGPVALSASLEPVSDSWPEQVEREQYHADNCGSLLAYDSSQGQIAWLGMPQLVGDGELYRWRERDGALLQRTGSPGLSALRFDPDGRHLVLAGPYVPPGMRGIVHEGFAAVLPLDGPKASMSSVNHGDLVTALASNDAWTRVASASSDSHVKLWQPLDARVVADLEHEAAVTAVAFSPDGFLLATGTAGGALRVWDGFNGEPLSENTWHESAVTSLTFVPDGQEIVVALAAGRVCRYSTASTVARRAVLETGQTRIEELQFLAGADARLLVRSEDRIEVWNAWAGRQQAEFLVGNSSARIADVTDGLVLVADGPTARIFESDNGREAATVTMPGDLALAHFAEGVTRLVLATTLEGRVVSPATGAALPSLSVPDEEIVSLHYIEPGRLLLATKDRVRMFDAASGAVLADRGSAAFFPVQLLQGDDSITSEMARSIVDVIPAEALDRVLVIYGRTGASLGQPYYRGRFVVEDAQVWRLQTLVPLAPAFGAQLPAHEINAATLVAAAGRIVTTGNKGELDFWMLESGVRVAAREWDSESLFHVAVAPDSAMVAVWGTSNDVTIWKVAGGDALGRPLRHEHRVMAVRFVRPGIVAIWTEGGEGGSVRLWDAVTGLSLGPPIAVGPGHRSVAVAPGGDLLVTVINPGFAALHRIGDTGLCTEAMAPLLALTETLSGWVVSPLGVEVRAASGIEVHSESPAWQAFRAWLDHPWAQDREALAGGESSLQATILGMLDRAPLRMAWLALEMHPAHPLALLRLAEVLPSGQQQDVNSLAMRVGAEAPGDLLAVSRMWVHLAHRQTGEGGDIAKRCQRVLSALASVAAPATTKRRHASTTRRKRKPRKHA